MSNIRGIIQTSPEDETWSSSKLWFHIANTAITIIYVWIGVAVARSPLLPIESFTWLTLVFAGVVTANKFANSFLNVKYGGVTKEKEVEVNVK